MSETTERLDAITARAADCQTYNFGLRNADQLAHIDVPYLLDLARKQAAALEAVAGVIDEWEMNAGPGTWAADVLGPQKVSVVFAVASIREALDDAQ